MDIRSWTVAQLLRVIIVYWAILAIGSALFARRPGLATRQAANRAAARPVIERGARPGELRVTYEMVVDFTRPLLLAVVPPAALVLAWVLL